MSRPRDPSPPGLTTTSYAVLAQLAVHPWSTYELARQRVRYFRYVWPRAESAIYREVKRLAAMRLVAARREYVGKRPRTVYSITEAGRQVLREWLDTPVSPFAMDFEAMIRLFIAPLGGPKSSSSPPSSRSATTPRRCWPSAAPSNRRSSMAGPRCKTRST